MIVHDNWQIEKYNDVYEEELQALYRRREHDKDLRITDIEGMLYCLYINEGNNWEGRGQLGDIVCSATIAAYESFIERWKIECQKAVVC